MSIRVMNAVREYGPAGPKNHNAFMVLFTLAHYANDSGQSCFPNVSMIAAAARLSYRSVKRGLADLKADGWIAILHKAQDSSCIAADTDKADLRANSYHINLGKLAKVGAMVAPIPPEVWATQSPNYPNKGPNLHKVGATQSKVGAKFAEPPDPLKGGSIRNNQEPSPPLYPEMVAQGVLQTLGLSGEKLLMILIDVCRSELTRGKLPDALLECMVSAWTVYSELSVQGKFTHTYGVPRFFSDGIWRDRGLWRWKVPPHDSNGNGKPSGAEQDAAEYRRLTESQQKVTVMSRKAAVNG